MDPGDSYFVQYLVNLASQLPELLVCVIGVFLSRPAEGLQLGVNYQ